MPVETAWISDKTVVGSGLKAINKYHTTLQYEGQHGLVVKADSWSEHRWFDTHHRPQIASTQGLQLYCTHNLNIQANVVHHPHFIAVPSRLVPTQATTLPTGPTRIISPTCPIRMTSQWNTDTWLHHNLQRSTSPSFYRCTLPPCPNPGT
jgi:hypothetical protein